MKRGHNVAWHAEQGLRYAEQGRYAEAERSFRAALALAPDMPELLANLGCMLTRRAAYEEGIRLLRRAAARNPRLVMVHYNLGLALHAQGDFTGASVSFEQAVSLDPSIFDARKSLLKTWMRLGEYRKALGHASKLVADPRTSPRLWPAALGVFQKLCDFEAQDEVCARLHAALRAGTFPPDALAEALLQFNYDDRLPEAEIVSWHVRWGKMTEAKVMAAGLAPAAAQAADVVPLGPGTAGGRRIRLGYLSPDFRRHSVGYFVRNVFASHDRDRFEVFCYSNTRNEDDVTAFIRAHVDHFRPVSDDSDASLTRRIRDDRLDLLVDLGGHAGASRAAVLAYRPAPVQVAWLGYPNTTGLSAVQYRIVDAHATGPADEGYTERLLRMPECFLSFGALEGEAADEPPPVLSAGHITFGSFNNLAKISRTTVRLWAAILEGVPESRLLVKARGSGDALTQANLARAFDAQGIAADRIVFAPWSESQVAHLNHYREVDIALDTWPYGGTTTTCEALWMGVPVVTLSGPAHRSRVSESILVNAGFPELVARQEAEFIGLAAGLALDHDWLGRIRAALPGRLRASILCDPDRFTRQLEQICLGLLPG